jgi:hypothetical protein
MNAKVVEIPSSKKPTSIIATLDELRDDLEHDRCSDFIIISRVKKPDIKSDSQYDGYEIKHNWMGRESAILSLGLLEYMKEKIKEYIWEKG